MPIAHKSTNVRNNIPRVLRWSLQALDTLAPPLAARATEQLFLTPARRAERPEGRAVFRHARRVDIPFAGERIATWSWGEGPAVLLVHGWGGRASQLHAFVEPIVARGFRAIAFDAPAHGESSGRTASLPQFALAIARMAERFGPFTGLVAHSLGAAAASVALTDGLEVERAVFIAPSADAAAYYDKFVHALGVSARVQKTARRRIEERLLVPFHKLNASRLAPRLDVPLLVVHDRTDAHVPWIDGAITADASPKGALVTTEGLGHRRILRDTGVVARAIEFVTDSDANRASTHTCVTAGCDGALVSQDECAQCELDRELYERDARWS